MFSFILPQIIRADGNPKKAMNILLIGVAINIVLDPVLIFLLNLGVTGAALATVTSQVIITILSFRYFKSKHSVLKILKNTLKLNAKRSLKTSKFGVAAFITQLTSSLVLVVANNSLKLHGGALSIGAMTIIAAVAQVFYTPVYGINQGAQPIIGFNFGAKKIKRTIDTVSKASIAATILMICAFLVVEIFPKEVIEIFNGNTNLIDRTIFGMRIYLFCLPLDGFQIIASNYFRSIGQVKIATFLGQLRKGLLFIPLVFILPVFWGITGVWLSGSIGDFLSFLITAIIFFGEVRKLKKSKDYYGINESSNKSTKSNKIAENKPVTDGVLSSSTTFNQCLQNDLMELINHYRKANEKSAYTTNQICQDIAIWKSNNMATKNYFSHNDPQGKSTVQALSNKYYVDNWKEAIALGTSTYAKKYTPTEIMEIAKSIFNGFKASPIHNAVMLSDNTLAGLGMSVVSNGNIYVSLDTASQAYSADTTSPFGSLAFNEQLRNAILNAFNIAQPTWQQAPTALNGKMQKEIPSTITELSQFNKGIVEIQSGHALYSFTSYVPVAIANTCSIQSIVQVFKEQMESYKASSSSHTCIYDVCIRHNSTSSLLVCLYVGYIKTI